jgi:hypothetical protein
MHSRVSRIALAAWYLGGAGSRWNIGEWAPITNLMWYYTPKERNNQMANSEYQKYHASTRMKQERALRNKNRRAALRSGAVSKGDGKEIDHRDGNPRNNSTGNKRVLSRHANRVKQ